MDNWAQGAEGRIFTEEFFGVWTASPGAAMTYLGIDRVFQPITAKVWTGSAWILRKIRFWSGAAGVLTTSGA